MQHLVLAQHNGVRLSWNVAPLAPRTLASYLERHLPAGSWRVSVVDFDDSVEAAAMAERLAELEPDAIGLSCYVWNAVRTYEACKVLDERLPEATLILGGPQLDLDEGDMAQLVRDLPGVDLFVQGEGELALRQYLETAPDRRPPTGSVVHGARLPDLSMIGAPVHAHFPPESGMICVEGVRGCPYLCGFCVWGVGDRSTRDRSMNDLQSELTWARDAGSRFITYAYFALNEKGKTRQRVDAIESVPLGDDVYHHYPLDYFVMTEEDVIELKRIKNGLGEFGVQSTYAPALKASRRGFSRRRLNQVVEWFHKHGLLFSMDVILGLPGDTLESFRGTLDELTQFGMPVNVAPLFVLPGSHLYTHRHELGLVYDRDSFHVRSTPTLSPTEFAEGMSMAREAMEKNRERFVAIEAAIQQRPLPAPGESPHWAVQPPRQQSAVQPQTQPQPIVVQRPVSPPAAPARHHHGPELIAVAGEPATRASALLQRLTAGRWTLASLETGERVRMRVQTGYGPLGVEAWRQAQGAARRIRLELHPDHEQAPITDRAPALRAYRSAGTLGFRYLNDGRDISADELRDLDAVIDGIGPLFETLLTDPGVARARGGAGAE